MNTKPRIVTIGGGTGSPTVLKALVLAGFSDISAISASMDSGGKTGIIRSDERDRVIAISDLLRNLLSLISPRQNHLEQVAAFTDLIGFIDGRSRNLGYTIYYALMEKYSNDFSRVQKHLEKLLNIKFYGTAIPVTTSSANICFRTETGSEFVGEHELDHQSMSTNTITEIWLDHDVPASPQAISAITNATHIIYSPGSIYGSIISNFLPNGITQAFNTTSAQKILITNLVSNRNQTHFISPQKYFDLFSHYTRMKKPFDVLVSPHLSRARFDRKYPKVAATYSTEHSHFLGWESKELEKLSRYGVSIIQADIFSITPQLNRIRHDPGKLAGVFSQIITP